ncbi:MAG: hypothetical protein ACE5GV_12460 [Candidatus Scalindua sp.]
MEIDKHIRRIIKTFGFNKVRKAMWALDWTWHGSKEPPTKGEMISVVWQLARSFKKTKDCVTTSTGGFTLKKVDTECGPAFELRFDIESANSFYVSEKEWEKRNLGRHTTGKATS